MDERHEFECYDCFPSALEEISAQQKNTKKICRAEKHCIEKKQTKKKQKKLDRIDDEELDVRNESIVVGCSQNRKKITQKWIK